MFFRKNCSFFLLTLGWSFVLIVANESLDQNKVFYAREKKIGSEK